MRYSEVTQALVADVPEVEFGYRRLKAGWNNEEPGVTIVLEDVLKPLLVSLAIANKKASLSRALRFLERLATDSDSHIRDLVAYSVYDLCRDDEALRTARPVMGPRTAGICKSVRTDDYKFSVGWPTS